MNAVCRPRELDIRGCVAASGLGRGSTCYAAEIVDLADGSIIWHYFEGDQLLNLNPLWRVVQSAGQVASVIGCLTEREIRDSLATDRPHYGDGTYATCHRAIHSACSKVRQAHGFDVSTRIYRAVFRVCQPTAFRKFSGTGGVCRTRPGDTLLRRGKLMFMGGPDDSRVQFLFIERYDGYQWRRTRDGM